MQNKKCTKCNVEYPATVEYFSERKETKSGLRAQCRTCWSLYQKQYEIKNKERRQEYRDSRVDERKQYYQENKEQRKKYLSDNAEHIKNRRKQYDNENSEHKSCVGKEYYKNNKESIAIRENLYREENAETIAERKKQYYQDNKETINKKHKIYNMNNREGSKMRSQKRRNLKASLVSDFTLEEWEKCLLFFDYKDAYTGLTMDISSQDHVIPLSKGGNYTVSNIVPCDKNINASKSNKDMKKWYRKQNFYCEKREIKILDYLNRVEG